MSSADRISQFARALYIVHVVHDNYADYHVERVQYIDHVLDGGLANQSWSLEVRQ